MRLSLPTVIGLVVIVGAGAFAAGQSTAPRVVATPASPASPPPAAMPTAMAESDEPLPPGHPPTGGAVGAGSGATGDLPPGHPQVDPMALTGAQMGAGTAPAAQSSLEWKVPPRWQSVPNASSMRLATFKVPRAPGDAEDADLSIMQAGGTVDANAERWIAQFDAASQKTAKRSTRKVGSLEVTIVEAKGNLAGGTGMGPDTHATSGRALIGAIVSTPGMPHFLKLTGPAASVLAARAEFDAMIASLVVH
ncbi:MAG TPA: hypothetical protein VLT33_28820 [Labilithrix sp.]|nr:hypothetical protein [Labilithrix sp.]